MKAGSPIADSLHASLAELQQHAASGRADYATRQRWLEGLQRMVTDHQAEWIAALNADFGCRSAVETRLAELFPALEGIRLARRRLGRWMRPQRRGVSLWFWPARAAVRPQPLGVAGIIVPWNYPLFLAIGPLTSALAAGNRAMVKMSELSPHSGELMARLCERYLGRDVVRVINGGLDVAAAFGNLPFDHLLFTGSTRVGRMVMQAAAANLTPVTLELGGKSPLLVTPGFDMARAAASVVAGKLLNAGQTCVAPDYVLVHADDRDAFVAALRAAARRAYPRLAGNPDYTAIINQAHYQRLLAWRDEAAGHGARVEALGEEDADLLAAERKFPLTLIEQAPAECAVMREEIFGPLLPIITYRQLGEALAQIRLHPKPLALYLFDDNRARATRVLDSVLAGGVCLNETLLHVAQDQLPFGGVGSSGMGHYHGYEGFVTFSKMLPVFTQSRLAGTALIRPPYGKVMQTLLRLMLGKVK
ncbi:coniferyl aldehyde dehydrogenase [Vogesella oryzae]|uniref:coniferyl aldehyde dehydrogenase n=1 Tax=Vogesella oryzae TaxID=1735285 RepID=UPI001581460A|nr:coniferyl aldehyde dehydrogenase [Vogesella oryzae]